MNEDIIKTMGHIFIRVDNFQKDSLTVVLYLFHNTENCPINILIWQSKGIINLHFADLERFIMKPQAGIDQLCLTVPSVSFHRLYIL